MFYVSLVALHLQETANVWPSLPHAAGLLLLARGRDYSRKGDGSLWKPSGSKSP